MKLVGASQENSRISTRRRIQFINIVTDLRHPLIFGRIKHRRISKVKGEDGISLSQGRQEYWRQRKRDHLPPNVLTPGSIRSCGVSRMGFPGGSPPHARMFGHSLDRKVLGIGILAWYFDVGTRDRVSSGTRTRIGSSGFPPPLGDYAFRGHERQKVRQPYPGILIRSSRRF